MIFISALASMTITGQVRAQTDAAAGVAEDHEALGWEHFNAGRLDEAESHFQKAIDSGNTQARRGLAETHRRRGDFDKAAREFRLLLDADPDNRDLQKQLASTLAAMPDHRDDAIWIYEQLIAQGPPDHKAQLELARLLAWTGRYSRSQSLLEKLAAAETTPRFKRQAQLALANTYAWSGQHHRAVALYHRLLDQARDAETVRSLADVEQWRGRPAHAIRLYQEAVRLDPQHQPTQDKLQRTEASIGPSAWAQTQYFEDSSRWRRIKTLEAARWHLGHDAWLNVGVETAHYKDATNGTADRAAAAFQGQWAYDTFSRLTADLSVGSATGSNTVVTGGAQVSTALEGGVDLTLHYRHGLVIDDTGAFDYLPYNSAFTVQTLEVDPLESDTLRLDGRWEPADRWQVILSNANTWIEDDNHRWETFVGVYYDLIDEAVTDLIVRAWFHRSNYKDISTLYFSPSDLQSYGIGFRLEHEQRQCKAHIDAGVFYQPQKVSDFGAIVSGGLDWRIDDRWRLGVSLDYLNTNERGGGRYHSGSVRVSVTTHF